MNILGPVAFVGADVNRSCHMHVHQQDEMQFLAVGILARERLLLLIAQLQKVTPGLGMHRFTNISLCLGTGLGLVIQFFVPNAKNYLKKKDENNTQK